MLQTTVGQGGCTYADLVWAEGMPTWVPLGQVLGVDTSASGAMAARGYAGFWPRVAAALIDLLVLMVPAGVVSQFGPPAPDFDKALNFQEAMRLWEGYSHRTAHLQLICAVIAWLYFGLMESSARQGSLGKIAMRLFVCDAGGNRLTFLRATGRFLAKNFFTVGITLGVGFLMAAFTQRKQAMHDLMASTLVLRK